MTDDERRAKAREESRKYRETHREYFRAYDRARSADRAESKKAWREANRDRVNETYRQYVAAHPELKKKKSEKAKGWLQDNPERAQEHSRWSHLASKYGISRADYAELLSRQDGKCAICGTDKPSGHYKRFHVDHEHESHKVRGLLCHSCNIGLGHFRDLPERLEAAARYLRSHQVS